MDRYLSSCWTFLVRRLPSVVLVQSRAIHRQMSAYQVFNGALHKRPNTVFVAFHKQKHIKCCVGQLPKQLLGVWPFHKQMLPSVVLKLFTNSYLPSEAACWSIPHTATYQVKCWKHSKNSCLSAVLFEHCTDSCYKVMCLNIPQTESYLMLVMF